MSTRISVVIPAFNAAAYLTETVQSLLSQLSDHDEILVVDDGSTDNTCAVCADISDPRVRLVQRANSGGPAAPRNAGCSEAKGEYIFLFDSDDIAEPDKISVAMKALENSPKASFLFTNFSLADSNGVITEHKYLDRYSVLKQLEKSPAGTNTYTVNGGRLLAALLRANFVGTCSVVFKKSVWLRTEGFNENLRHLDDRDMWLQLCRHGDAVFVDHSSFRYRQHESGISSQRIRAQHLERVAVAERVKQWDLDTEQKNAVHTLAAKNYLKLGYIDFHDQGNIELARNWFARSFINRPSYPAFKGMIKSVVPQKLYLMLSRN
jgi:glycosyltransferase involved in cell wall biosynthesis